MIIIIDNYDSFTYNLYQLLAKIHPDVQVFRNDVITVAQIADLQPEAIVISPGPGTPQQSGICIELIATLYKDFPILGICLGHQAIGVAFGGKVVGAETILHGKTSLIFHQRKGIFKGISLPFEGGRYHSLIVEKNTLPTDLEIIAVTADGTIMALKHKNYPCYGLQFHPESILTQYGDLLIAKFFELEIANAKAIDR